MVTRMLRSNQCVQVSKRTGNATESLHVDTMVGCKERMLAFLYAVSKTCFCQADVVVIPAFGRWRQEF